MIRAILSNPNRPDLDAVPVCFPMAEDAAIIENLQEIGIGSATKRDCYIRQIEGSYPVLKRLEESLVNVDELNYLAKRLESFDKHETAKFQGVVVSEGLSNMTDLINLTFCAQEVTIVRDFSCLETVGRQHYLDKRIAVSEEEMRTVDFKKEALNLLLNCNGSVTPYGVVYQNGMELAQVYDSCNFPDYDYTCNSLLTVAMTPRCEPENTEKITWLRLPMPDICIERSMLRAGIDTIEDACIAFSENDLPGEVATRITLENETLQSLNALCGAVARLNGSERQKLKAAIQLTDNASKVYANLSVHCPELKAAAQNPTPRNITEIIHLAEQLELFEFVEGITTPEEYGRYMIKESGHFEYDDNLAEYYDFKRYGEQRVSNECGAFTTYGYISYHGFISLEEILAGCESHRLDMTMGGM